MHVIFALSCLSFYTPLSVFFSNVGLRISNVGLRISNVGLRISGLQNVHFKKEFFGGLEDISIGNMQMSIIIVHFVKYQIYLARCRNRLPTVPQCMYELEGLVSSMSRGETWREQVEDIRELVGRMME